MLVMCKKHMGGLFLLCITLDKCELYRMRTIIIINNTHVVSHVVRNWQNANGNRLLAQGNKEKEYNSALTLLLPGHFFSFLLFPIL